MRAAFEELTRYHTADASADPGFFSWDISKDKIYGDRTVASLFGHDHNRSASGIALQGYMERIHPGNRSQVAKAIRETLLHDTPFHETCLVLGADGHYSEITALGRCFRKADGEPVHWPGLVIPHAKDAGPDDKMIWHCLSAYDLAVNSGQEHLARQMLSILKTIMTQKPTTGFLQ